MNRRNEILVVTLVVQLVLILLITTLRSPAAAAPAKPLFAGLKTADVQAITIQEPAGAKIDLVETNNNWTLPAQDDYPGDTSRINTFIGKLLNIQTGRLIAHNASSYPRLEVADGTYVKRVLFKTTDGKTHTLLIGSSGGGGAVYVRADGAAEVWLTDAINNTDASTSAVDWINPTLFTIKDTDVTGLTITNHNGTFDFVNTGKTWIMKGLTPNDKLDTSKVTDAVARLVSLTINSPLGKSPKPEYGLQPPTATITLTLSQTSSTTKPIVIKVGAKDTSNSVYTVYTSVSPYYLTVSSYTLDDFVTRQKKDFLILPPTAVPTATVAPIETPVATASQ